MTYNEKARQTQLDKYGGEEGYSAEMRRRSSLRKTHSGGRGTTEDKRRRAKLAWEKRKNANQDILSR